MLAEVAIEREGAELAAERALLEARATAEEQAAAVARVHEQAEREAEAARRLQQLALAEHVRDIRERAEVLATTIEHRNRATIAGATARATDIEARARAALEAATGEAAHIKAQAQQAGERLLRSARAEANAQETRARQRLTEAEAGVRLVHERSSADFEAMQREAYETALAAREEAVAVLTQARADADAVRADARSQMTRARDEVAVLTRRREEVTAQLGQLSGALRSLTSDDEASRAWQTAWQPMEGRQ
jgi:hypothetical protein